MAQRQFRTDDTSTWNDKFGTGSDGSFSTTGSITDSSRSGFANTTFSATSGSTSATFGSGTGFSNGDLILIHQTRNGGNGAGTWELNKITSGGGTTSVTLAYSTVQAYDTTAQVYRLPQYSSVNINSGHTLTSTTWDGSKGGIIALLCNGTTTIDGTVTSKGKGYRGGPSFVAGASATGKRGEGINADNSTQAQTASGNGAGGGQHDGGNRGAGGGGGGHANTGSNGSNNANTGSILGGAGGSSAGNSTLTTMVFGGGAGSGTGDSGQTTFAGGNGGGIILIISKTITITGSVISGGDNGTNGATARSGSGGGAGGSVLMKGQTITLGTSLVTSSKGTGGAANDPNFEPAGGDGSDGRIHIDYSSSISGSTSPTLDSSLDSIFTDPVTAVETSYSFFM